MSGDAHDAYEDTLVKLKLKYKKLYDEQFHQIVNQRKHILPSFTVSLFKPHQREEVKTCLAYSFSCLANDQVKSSVFAMGIVEIYNMVDEFIDESLKYGRAIVAIDKYNHVAAVLFGQDMCDLSHDVLHENPDLRNRTQKHHAIYRHVDSLLYNESFGNIPVEHNNLYKIYHKQYKNANELKSLYGIYEWGKMICIRPDCNGIHLYHWLHYIHLQIMGRLGYKYQIYRTSNQRMINLFSQIPFADCMIDYVYKNHTFEDGSTMDDIFYELENKYYYNKNQIENLKNECRVTLWLLNAKQHYEFILQKIKNIKNKMQSKL